MRGRHADRPGEITALGLKDVCLRVFDQISRDRVSLLAAGVTYYALFAIFPMLALLVTIYGFVAKPSSIVAHAQTLTSFLPSSMLGIFMSQLKQLASQPASTLSISAGVSTVLALWSCHNGILALFAALNAAYNEHEKRSMIRLNAIGLMFTVAAIVLAILMIGMVGVIPVILGFLGLGGLADMIALAGRWPLLAAIAVVCAAILYRFGPSRKAARLQWLSWGSLFCGLGWCAVSILYSAYLQNFANFQATYGTLGALIGFMMWVWLSVIVLLVGAEINAELEHQTGKDTTTGEPKPMGHRGAYVADTLGRATD